MTRAVALFTTLASLVLIICPAWGEDTPAAATGPDLAKGQAVASQVCAACHGPDGNAIAVIYPKLAGQPAQYIVKQLKNFKTGDRVNPIMGPYAAALSESDMENVAAYFAKQSVKPAMAKIALDKNVLGQKIYRAGLADKGVPACAACHGPAGAGLPAQYPALGGQWPEYSAAQLTAFHDGVRHNGPMMLTISQRMSDSEIKAVSDYMAGLH